MSENVQNCVLIDWLSITSKIHSPEDIIDLLGLSKMTWEKVKGAHGYKDRLYWEKISIHYNGSPDMGVWLEMSGQGCRAFESFGTGDFDYLFALVLENQGEMKITRLDIAYDDHTGVLPIDTIAQDTLAHRWVSDFYNAQVLYDIDRRKSKDWRGISCYYGSMSSEALVRIYDKAKERGFDDRHWIRVELQLRRDRALSFARQIQNVPIGTLFRGVLHKYLRFVHQDDDSDDSNMRRWPTTAYWATLLDGVDKINIYSKPGTDYNMYNLESFVGTQAGGAVYTFLETHPISEFLALIRDRDPEKLNPKYRTLIHEFGGRRDDDIYKAEREKLDKREEDLKHKQQILDARFSALSNMEAIIESAKRAVFKGKVYE